MGHPPPPLPAPRLRQRFERSDFELFSFLRFIIDVTIFLLSLRLYGLLSHKEYCNLACADFSLLCGSATCRRLLPPDSNNMSGGIDTFICDNKCKITAHAGCYQAVWCDREVAIDDVIGKGLSLVCPCPKEDCGGLAEVVRTVRWDVSLGVELVVAVIKK